MNTLRFLCLIPRKFAILHFWVAEEENKRRSIGAIFRWKTHAAPLYGHAVFQRTIFELKSSRAGFQFRNKRIANRRGESAVIRKITATLAQNYNNTQ